ncbi:MAG: alpha/beta fold hydrolase [Clostridia bacterium]|nr:alpha/beta fold hydrolase [Clostridia bacterium]
MMIKTAAAILSAAVILAVCVFAMAQEGPRGIITTTDAEFFIGALLGEKPEELEGVFLLTPPMEAAAKQAGGIAGLAGQLKMLGSLREALPAYEGKLQGYKAFYVPCVFTVMPVDLILVTQDGALAGLVTGPYTGDREQETETGTFTSTALSLPAPPLGDLPGTLTLPKGDGPFPAVVLLPGSGPVDRDGTVGALKPLRDIAEGLAKAGIASYRFDKRTVAYSAETAADLSFTLEDEYITDTVSAVRLLAAREKIDPERIFVLGHSLGASAVPAAAASLREDGIGARGFIMMAASPRPLSELMREQIDFLYSLMLKITPEQQAEKDALLKDLDRLKDLDSLSEDDMIAGAYKAYWKYLKGYDILEAAGGITSPVLLLQGEEDYQVTMTDYEIWQEAFRDKANWRMISFPGLTHAFTPGKKTQGASAYAREGKVDEKVIQSIADFINGAR